MSLEELVSTYGYAAIAIGTFFEGETILVLGGFSAHLGYLQLPWVIVCALLGSFLGDQAYFYIGRSKGMELLNSRPKWKAKSEKVFSLLDRHQVWLILSFRFLYGLRTVTPFLVGMAGVSPFLFFALNFISASLWAIVVGTLGYLFGHAIEVLIGDIKRYEILFFAIIAGIGLTVWLGHFMIRRSNK
ncbi:DedA family protein [Litchfieldella qijiaojingensis]|uniref:DedA family protein n=1 Tax=Litchfieldella qijiaojingensis TaxID=980347 RepID=UPI00167414A6|nr:DedA family protein [Halomonas qijiaojingensis]